jgi:nitrogenase molybdenum-cofactor synthesis protein NifE
VRRALIKGYHAIAIISGPTRAIAMTQFLHELGINPRLIVIDFDSDLKSRLAAIVGPDCEILIEPEQEEIIEQLKEKSIDLIIGGMLERPIAAMVGIDYLDIMHGSQQTVGFEGADTLMDLLKSKRRKMK